VFDLKFGKNVLGFFSRLIYHRMIFYNDNYIYVIVSFVYLPSPPVVLVAVASLFLLLFWAIENQFLFKSRARSSFI